jgi:hypothetical protein
VAKQTSKGSRHQRRAAAIERKATHHHQFIGEAAAERAESELQKHERLQAEENREVVRQMASEMEEAAGTRGDGAAGPEFPLRIPRSVEEARDLVREAPDAFREKARERLSNLPEPAQKVLHVAESAIAVLFIPMRLGLTIAYEAVRLPFRILRGMRQREA